MVRSSIHANLLLPITAWKPSILCPTKHRNGVTHICLLSQGQAQATWHCNVITEHGGRAAMNMEVCHACRDYLVDYVAGRYGEPYQSAYRSDQVLQLPLKVAQGEGEWDTLGLPQALREFPPTVTAAGWVAQVCLLPCLLPVAVSCDCAAAGPVWWTCWPSSSTVSCLAKIVIARICNARSCLVTAAAVCPMLDHCAVCSFVGKQS